jgi:hypothetical protein
MHSPQSPGTRTDAGGWSLGDNRFAERVRIVRRTAKGGNPNAAVEASDLKSLAGPVAYRRGRNCAVHRMCTRVSHDLPDGNIR